MFTCSFLFKYAIKPQRGRTRSQSRDRLTIPSLESPKSLLLSMGSEESIPELHGGEFDNGDAKKNDDLTENGNVKVDGEEKTSDEPKQQNGAIRNRKGKLIARDRSEHKKSASLRPKPPGKKQLQKSSFAKFVSVFLSNKRSWLVQLSIFSIIVALGFVTRMFTLALPAHIWLVRCKIRVNVLFIIYVTNPIPIFLDYLRII